jgi:hypothetical protein
VWVHIEPLVNYLHEYYNGGHAHNTPLEVSILVSLMVHCEWASLSFSDYTIRFREMKDVLGDMCKTDLDLYLDLDHEGRFQEVENMVHRMHAEGSKALPCLVVTFSEMMEKFWEVWMEAFTNSDSN